MKKRDKRLDGYIPAITIGSTKSYTRKKYRSVRVRKRKRRRVLAWWQKDAYFRHTSVLISAYYGMKYPDISGMLNARDDVIVVADSGGYQIATQGAKINPKEVLKWAEKNSDIVFALDVPEFVVVSKSNKKFAQRAASFEECKERADASAENNRVYAAERKGNCKIYNVLHGADLKKLRYWYKKVGKYKFDGWATGVRPPGDPLLQVLLPMFLWDRGVREDVHVFGISGFTTIPALAYLSRFIKNLSFDSVSYLFYGSLLREYLVPGLLYASNNLIIGDKVDYKVDVLPCSCPICRSVVDPLDLKKSGGGADFFISLHNLYLLLDITNILYKLSRVNRDVYVKYVKTFAGERAMRAIDFCDAVEAHGIEWAVRDFRSLLDMQEPTEQFERTLIDVEQLARKARRRK